MEMQLQNVVNALADEADELLDGVATRKEARPLIREYLEGSHPELDQTEQAEVLSGVFGILEDEGFFEAPSGPDLRYDGSVD